MFNPEFTPPNNHAENTPSTFENINFNSSFITIVGELQIQASEVHFDNCKIEAGSIDVDGKLTLQNSMITSHSITTSDELSLEFNGPSYFSPPKLANGNAAYNYDEVLDHELGVENNISTIRFYNRLGIVSGELNHMGYFTSYSNSNDLAENSNDTEQTIHSDNDDNIQSDPEMPELEEAAPSCTSLQK